MKNRKGQLLNFSKAWMTAAVLLLALTVGCAMPGSKTTGQSDGGGAGRTALRQPQAIPADASCGKCGMYPAQYPRWQSQIIFKDGTMTPFDGCKCMFNFLFAMDKFDQIHSRDDVEVAWVKDFNSGAWINAMEAHFVVGSNIMGPMGKELIPFAEPAAAMKFHQEQGGSVMQYGDITTEVMKTLGMGGMKMEHGGRMRM